MANVKNYIEPGGETTVIGGTLVVNGTLELGEGAEAVGLPKAANVAACTGTTAAAAIETINAVISALISAGLMEDAGSA